MPRNAIDPARNSQVETAHMFRVFAYLLASLWSNHWALSSTPITISPICEYRSSDIHMLSIHAAVGPGQEPNSLSHIQWLETSNALRVAFLRRIERALLNVDLQNDRWLSATEEHAVLKRLTVGITINVPINSRFIGSTSSKDITVSAFDLLNQDFIITPAEIRETGQRYIQNWKLFILSQIFSLGFYEANGPIAFRKLRDEHQFRMRENMRWLLVNLVQQNRHNMGDTEDLSPNPQPK